MSGVLLDVVLLLVLVAYLVSGYRRGLFHTLVSAAGFLGGAALGLVLLPDLVARYVPAVMWRPVVLLLLTIACGALTQALFVRLTWRMQLGLRRSWVRGLDSVLGAVVTVVVAAAVLWFGAGLLRIAAPGPVARAVSDSQLLGTVDRFMPATTEQLVGRVVLALDAYGFPRVFGRLEPEPIAPADPADDATTGTAGVERARESIYRIDVLAPACGRGQEGSGWVADDGLVVTNAHVVAGGDGVSVTRGDGRHRAHVVAFDPDRDLAVLAVPGLEAPPLELGEDLRAGDSAVVAGYPLGGPYQVDAARVRGVLSARGEDIYGRDRVVREVYALRVGIVPGNSGGPLLTEDGRVSGVVFARSLDDPDTGYALTLDEARPVLDQARRAGGEVSTGACAA